MIFFFFWCDNKQKEITPVYIKFKCHLRIVSPFSPQHETLQRPRVLCLYKTNAIHLIDFQGLYINTELYLPHRLFLLWLMNLNKIALEGSKHRAEEITEVCSGNISNFCSILMWKQRMKVDVFGKVSPLQVEFTFYLILVYIRMINMCQVLENQTSTEYNVCRRSLCFLSWILLKTQKHVLKVPLVSNGDNSSSLSSKNLHLFFKSFIGSNFLYGLIELFDPLDS